MHAILLAGLAVAGLPVVLHLLMKRQPKRLPFPALRFLMQRHRVTQRRLRLRHFLLLLLRILLILLFSLVLYQPRVLDESLGLSQESPVLAVIIIDDSPSMSYTVGVGQIDRLSEARQRAEEFVKQLPEQSQICILKSSEILASWEVNRDEAIRKIQATTEIASVFSPLTTSLGQAYSLLKRTIEDDQSEMPKQRVIALFSDRTANSWTASNLEELIKVHDSLPEPKVIHLYFDVGIESPVNVQLGSVQLKPQLLSGSGEATVTTNVTSLGQSLPALEVQQYFDEQEKPESYELKNLERNVPVSPTLKKIVAMEREPGFHRLRVEIRSEDGLRFDNVRYSTFEIAQPRKMLTISDDPASDAVYWAAAHKVGREFVCDTTTPQKIPNLEPYEVVCLLNVADPRQKIKDQTLWERLGAYVQRGGKLLVIPGGLDSISLDAYQPAASGGLMPGSLTRVKNWQEDSARKTGVIWALESENDIRSSLFEPYREWFRRGNIDVVRQPRRVWQHWLVQPTEEATVLMTYKNDDEKSKQFPAILEKSVGQGKVVMLTTRFDPQWDKATAWNDYWELTNNSFLVSFPKMLMWYLVGRPEDARYNFLAGRDLKIAAPRDSSLKEFRISGPGITESNQKVSLTEGQRELIIRRDQNAQPGHYRLQALEGSWSTEFSSNIPLEESNLESVPEDALTPLLGENSIIRLNRKVDLRDSLESKYDQPVELFPWLLLAMLLFFTLEGLVSNRFYGRNRGTSPL